MPETLKEALPDTESRSADTADLNFQSAVNQVRRKVHAAAEHGLALKVLSKQDALSLKAGLENIESDDQLRGWLRFVNDPNGLSSQLRKYEEVRAKFDQKMRDAREYISTKSFSEWQDCFHESGNGG